MKTDEIQIGVSNTGFGHEKHARQEDLPFVYNLPLATMANTVIDALALCGVPNGNVLFDGRNAATRISSDVFGDDFNTCMDLSFEDLDNDWKSYSSLTAAQGQIRLQPNVKKNIRALIQWSRDKIRTGQNPADEPFPVGDAMNLIQRYNTHKLWTGKASDKAKTTVRQYFRSF